MIRLTPEVLDIHQMISRLLWLPRIILIKLHTERIIRPLPEPTVFFIKTQIDNSIYRINTDLPSEIPYFCLYPPPCGAFIKRPKGFLATSRSRVLAGTGDLPDHYTSDISDCISLYIRRGRQSSLCSVWPWWWHVPAVSGPLWNASFWTSWIARGTPSAYSAVNVRVLSPINVSLGADASTVGTTSSGEWRHESAR